MNNHRKIGFRAYNDNAQNSEEDEQKKKQAERQKAIADFIGHNYSPIGATSQKCYKTQSNWCTSCRISSMSLRWSWPSS